MSISQAPGPDTKHIFPPLFNHKGLDPAYFLKCGLAKLVGEIPDQQRQPILRQIYADNTARFPSPELLASLLRRSWLLYDLETRSRQTALPFTIDSLQIVLFCRSVKNVRLVLNDWKAAYTLPLTVNETMAVRHTFGRNNPLGLFAKACETLNRMPP